MVRAVKGQGHRARHQPKVNRLEQQDRVREIIRALPEEQRTVSVVTRKLEDKGISLSTNTIYKHLSAVKEGVGGNGSNLLVKIEAVSKALKACGGQKGVKDTIKLIERLADVVKG